jgi:hypothetical protein
MKKRKGTKTTHLTRSRFEHYLFALEAAERTSASPVGDKGLFVVVGRQETNDTLGHGSANIEEQSPQFVHLTKNSTRKQAIVRREENGNDQE